VRHSQPRSRDGARIPTGTSLLPEIRVEVAREARYYGVSKSWVAAVAFARFFGVVVPPEADYRMQPWTTRSRRKPQRKR
jgi:hypothetical protein